MNNMSELDEINDEFKDKDENSIKALFDDQFDFIKNAIISVQENYQCLRYLLSPDSNNKITEEKRKHIFFALFIENSAVSIYINLHKLFSDGEDYSLLKFINIITSKIGPFAELNIPAEIKKGWKRRITTPFVKELISHIAGVRNDGIAHFKDRKDSKNKEYRHLSFHETEGLLKIATDVLKDIYSYGFGQAYTIDQPLNSTLRDLQEMLNALVDYPAIKEACYKLQLKSVGITLDNTTDEALGDSLTTS